MTSTRHQLIEEYLHQFDNASVFLAADRREELRQEIAEHIDSAIEEADAQFTEVVRVVLERVGPPADIVAAELGGPRSTGSTPVVQPLGPVTDVARKHESGHESQAWQRQDDSAAPPVPPSPKRRRVAILIGTAATSLVLAGLAYGISASNDSGTPPADYQAPATTPTQSEESASERPSETPTDGYDSPTAPTSDEPSETQAVPD